MLCPIEYFLESSDVDYMESEDQIAKTFDLLTFAVYEEANEKSSIVNNIEKTIESFIEKIKKIFNDAKDAITNFFSKNGVEKECKEEGKKQTTICKNLSEKIKSLSENDPKRKNLVISYNNEKKKT